jgi:hypothetical protein
MNIAWDSPGFSVSPPIREPAERVMEGFKTCVMWVRTTLRHSGQVHCRPVWRQLVMYEPNSITRTSCTTCCTTSCHLVRRWHSTDGEVVQQIRRWTTTNGQVASLLYDKLYNLSVGGGASEDWMLRFLRQFVEIA